MAEGSDLEKTEAPSRRFWVESENRWINLRLTTHALRTIDKNGIDSVLATMRARGEHV